MSETYNGWKNYETWCVKLWIENSDGGDHWRERAAEIYREASATEVLTIREAATYQLAEQIKSEHEENAPEISGIYADLLNAAMSEVDWDEVAGNILDDDLVAEIDAEADEPTE